MSSSGNVLLEMCIKLASETKNEIPTTSIREIKIMQNLDHSNIVSLREVVPSTGIAVCTAIDMWAVGCIFAELLKQKPLCPAQNEMDALPK